MLPIKIALILGWRQIDFRNQVIGDEKVALGWQKYLSRMPEVERVDVLGPNDLDLPESTYDWAIYFHHLPANSRKPKIGKVQTWYVQNAWSNIMLPDGCGGAKHFTDTLDVFRWFNHRFDSFMFLSDSFRDAARVECPIAYRRREMAAVIPFASDSEVMKYQHDEGFAHPIVFVGAANVRRPEQSEKYLLPLVDRGLAIYGSGWNCYPQYAKAYRGIISDEDLPKVYSSSVRVIDIRHPEHAKWKVSNQRIFDVLSVKIRENAPSFRETPSLLLHEDEGNYVETISSDLQTYGISYKERAMQVMAFYQEMMA